MLYKVTCYFDEGSFLILHNIGEGTLGTLLMSSDKRRPFLRNPGQDVCGQEFAINMNLVRWITFKKETDV